MHYASNPKPLPALTLSIGAAIRCARERCGLSQQELARQAGTSQATISAIENNRLAVGIERAKTLARIMCVHPASLVFPDWDTPASPSALLPSKPTLLSPAHDRASF